MLEFLAHLFDTSGFPSRWNCGDWSVAHGWLHVLSDLGVWSAYVAIPAVLAYFVLRRNDVPFRPVFLLFAAFILACGTTHLVEAAIFWWPAYRLAGVVKLLTAIVSWATVFALVPVAPKALAMRTPQELEREIEERKRVEQDLRTTQSQLKRSLDEKEVLLREIHHRVKNNLQIISSLLQLQGEQTRDPGLKEIMQESQNRVRSMALVHERLYKSTNLAQVDFGEYLQSLARSLFHSYRADSNRIRLAVDVHGIHLPIDTAIPCGLAVSELLSNCLKYAFPDGRSGAIHVELAPQDDRALVLSVRDDGVGFPEGATLDHAETFGSRLVGALVQQLHGTFELDRTAGTTIRITFPRP
jgi:two-component sensor histidine kinase